MKHVYLHVPFCRRRCSYCDFSIAVRRAIPAAQYVAAIKRERDLLFASGEWDDQPLQTLYLGGGTPSLLPPESVAELVAFFLGSSSRFPFPASRFPTGRRGLEVTIEANPDDVTPPVAAAWRAAGVNRVSLGVQSFSPAILRWMHRTHRAGQAGKAVRALRRAGFDNVSLDLIFALPGALRPNLRRDLEKALALEPDHLSVYGLSVEPRTPLARWISAGAIAPSGDERYADEFLLAHEVLTDAGFEHYEVSNYARPGRRSRHNAAYWTGEPYAGLGPAAHGFAGRTRRWNISPWAAYERTVHQGKSPEAGREILSEEERSLERVYLGLRTRSGVARLHLGSEAEALLEDAVQAGLLERRGRRIRATPKGWLALDAMVARLSACWVT
ncbi:MAG: radical SAM family heme chaperone HemW [Gemmatimonadetes bacterium]|nr:radical SAM family heme chaperone HemW [Gemmatimonadota bacterium]